MTTTHVLETPEADVVYDVHGPAPADSPRPPLLMVGQPMDAGGFSTLASYFPDRTVVTYDPRGLGRSVRKDGREDHVPTIQAEDLHGVIQALGAGAVEVFGSSGAPSPRLRSSPPIPRTSAPSSPTNRRSSGCCPTPPRPSGPGRPSGTPTRPGASVPAWRPSSR